jgi:hypothetical protein
MSVWDEIKLPAGAELSFKTIPVQGIRLWSWAKDIHGNIGIAIECPSEFFDVSQFANTKEFKIEINRSSSNPILTILCANDNVDEQLQKFCLDLVEQTSRISNDFEFRLALKNRINAWCELFRLGSKKLKHHEILGLAAELTFLDTWIYKLSENIEDWVGPLNAQQDFISTKNNLACEVKATSWDPVSVSISSIEQLSFKGKLILVVYPTKLTDKDENLSYNLVKIIDKLKQKLNQEGYLSLLNKLIIAGYDEEECKDIYFQISSPIIYEIKDNFPRITNDSVHKNIIDCNYKLLLKDLETYKSFI